MKPNSQPEQSADSDDLISNYIRSIGSINLLLSCTVRSLHSIQITDRLQITLHHKFSQSLASTRDIVSPFGILIFLFPHSSKKKSQERCNYNRVGKSKFEMRGQQEAQNRKEVKTKKLKVNKKPSRPYNCSKTEVRRILNIFKKLFPMPNASIINHCCWFYGGSETNVTFSRWISVSCQPQKTNAHYHQNVVKDEFFHSFHFSQHATCRSRFWLSILEESPSQLFCEGNSRHHDNR